MAKKKRQYSEKASEEVGEAIHKYKRGEQRSGTKSKAKSRKQAIAIGLSKARKEGAKVPKKASRKKASSKKTSSKKSRSKKSSSKKSTARKSSKKKAASKRKAVKSR